MTTADERRQQLAAPDRRHVRDKLQALIGATAVLDVLMLLLATVASWHGRARFDDAWMTGSGPRALPGPAIPLIVAVWLLLMHAYGAYNQRNFGAGPNEFRAVATGSLMAAGVVGLGGFLFDVSLSRGFIVLTFLLGVPLLLLERYVVRKSLHSARSHGHLLHRVIAIGGPSGIGEVVESLRRDRHVGYEVVGVCLPAGIAVETHRFVVPVVGLVEDVRRLCRELDVDTVLVARGGFDTAHELRQVAWALEGSTVDLIVIPSLTDVAGPRIHMRPVAGLPLVHVEQPQAGSAGGMSKRSFDVVLASAALVVCSPLLLVVAVLVKLQDGGPVVFRQRRVGRHGRPFAMYKFRSMVVDAETRVLELADLNESDGVLFKMREDPRVTPMGRFLRRYSVDELPQLVNVLRGEMSIVGPRPPLPSEVDRYAIDVHRRLLVRPGLTGLWQVSGRTALSWDESVRLDLYYVDNWSMMSDLVIIAKTVTAVVGRSGAY